jgi:[ribosomal protein S5]-alanine N-acetyltransferase
MIYTLDAGYYVRPLQESDLNGPYPTWFSDQDICRYNSHGKFFKNNAYFIDYLEGLNNEKQVVWAICHEMDGHIGNICLQDISFINRNAEIAFLLGDKRHWGKRVSFMAGQKLLEHGFNKLNIERIYCGTASTNKGMMKLALSLGMQQEGCRRSHLYLDGSWVDLIEYGILRHEFLERYSE